MIMLILLSITSLLFAKDTCKVQTDCPANNICFQLNNLKTKESTTMCKETKKCSKDTDCGEKQTCTAANICLEKSVKVVDSNHLLEVAKDKYSTQVCSSDAECPGSASPDRTKCRVKEGKTKGICIKGDSTNAFGPVLLEKQ